ncbi:MAG: hypothetical protein ACQCN3_13675 [Candidatus Bathyarchaeia archaeon]|jgi:hypothetical protein
MTESVKKPIVLSFVQLVTFLFSVGSVLIVGLFMFLSKFIAVPFAGWFWFVLGLMGLFLIVFLFSNKIYVWFLANLYWVSFLLFLLYLVITQASAFGNTWGQSWLIIFPFVYSIGCIAYFQTQKIKQYFNIKQKIS